MKRDKYVPLLRAELKRQVTNLAEEEELATDLEEIDNAHTIGQLFSVMSRHSFDIQGAVGLAMRFLIEDALDWEFADVPIRDWVT